MLEDGVGVTENISINEGKRFFDWMWGMSIYIFKPKKSEDTHENKTW